MSHLHHTFLPVALAIGGTDPAGLAGLPVDLKTFASLRIHGLAAAAAVTAQHSRAVRAVRVLPASLLRAQLDTLDADFSIAAVKIGMLGSAANIRTVADWLCGHPTLPVVLDPVLVSSSGTALLAPAALSALRDQLLPRATLLTPNLPEAQTLLGRRVGPRFGAAQAAEALRALGPAAVLLKGGHARGRGAIADVLVDARGAADFRHPRLAHAARGTGCALSSAIAAHLARGLPLRRAVAAAERWLQARLRHARPVGRGGAFALDFT